MGILGYILCGFTLILVESSENLIFLSSIITDQLLNKEKKPRIVLDLGYKTARIGKGKNAWMRVGVFQTTNPKSEVLQLLYLDRPRIVTKNDQGEAIAIALEMNKRLPRYHEDRTTILVEDHMVYKGVWVSLPMVDFDLVSFHSKGSPVSIINGKMFIKE